jgi:hypothetical protein
MGDFLRHVRLSPDFGHNAAVRQLTRRANNYEVLGGDISDALSAPRSPIASLLPR